MSDLIAQPTGGELVPASPDNPGATMMNFIAMALTNPAIETAKLRELLDMQKGIIAEEARIKFIEAMRDTQAEIMPVVRGAENKATNSMYAKLEAIDAAIRPIYTRHGFTLSFDEEAGDAATMQIVCLVEHVAGHAKRFSMFAPPDTMGPKGTPTKTALHGRGSTTTFLRRYLMCNVFNVVLRGMDDDGNRGGMKLINEGEAMQLEALLLETKSDRPRFMQHFRLANLLNMPRDALIAATNMLLTKLPPDRREVWRTALENGTTPETPTDG